MKTLKKRAEFKKLMPELDLEKIIVIDESGCYLNMILDYARANSGERISMAVPFIRGTKISLIGAISSHGVEAAVYGQWNTNGEIFLTFIKEQLLPKLTGGNIIIMDNVQFHKSQTVIDAIEATGAKVMFLPPYSPDLSPIENMWGKIKQILKKLAPRSMRAFNQAMSKAFLEIRKTDLLAWFKYCGFYVEPGR